MKLELGNEVGNWPRHQIVFGQPALLGKIRMDRSIINQLIPHAAMLNLNESFDWAPTLYPVCE